MSAINLCVNLHRFASLERVCSGGRTIAAGVRRIVLAVAMLLAIGAWGTGTPARAQCPPAWSALGVGTNNTVRALAVLPGGDVIVGGAFATAGGVAVNNIARYNPTTGVWSALGSGTNGGVNALTVLPGGDVIAGGGFSTAGGVPARNIARCNPTAGTWSALGSGTNGDGVKALTVLPGGDLIVGGTFTTAGGVPVNNIARCTGTGGWSWSALGSGVTGGFPEVNALAAVPGGDLIVGGRFTNAGGVVLGSDPTGNIARCFLGAPVPSITYQPLSQAVAVSSTIQFGIGATGGSVLTYQWRKDGVAINTIANPSAATATLALTNVQAADAGSYDCLVGNSCGGAGTLSNAATLSVGADPCPVDFNGDGFLDFFDYADFVEAFEIGC